MTFALKSDNQARILRVCLDLIYGQTRTAWLSNAFCIALLWIAFWPNVNRGWMLGWTVVGALLMFMREIQARRYAARANQDLDTKRWTQWVEVSQFANGCFWGIGCAVLIMTATPYQLPVILLVAGGLQTGSVLASSYLLRAFALFSVPLFLFTLVPFLLLGFRDESALLVTAALLVVSSLFTFVCASRFGSHYKQSVGYSLENLDLAKSLQTKNSEIEGLNSSMQERITELKTAQRALLEEKQRSDEAAQAKASFLATMSHEIRTPMNGVLGMAQLLESSQLDAEQTDYVETILSSGKTLLTIINDILDVSKIEAGNLTLDPQPANLRLLIEDISHLLSATPACEGITLDIAYAAELPEEFLVDDTRLRQVLMNLIGNALKFTDTGSVFVDVSRNSKEDSNELFIDVCDTGIGIPENKLGDIFQKFNQAESSTTRRFGGTGLGLSISNALIDAMGGVIEVTSVYGEGSRFRIRLSLETAAGIKLPATTEKEAIIVFTQDRWFLKSISSHARKKGLQAIHAGGINELNNLVQKPPQPLLAMFVNQQEASVMAENPAAFYECDVPLVLVGADPALFDSPLMKDRTPRKLSRPFRHKDFSLAIYPDSKPTLPATKAQTTTPSALFQGCRVLLVDDNAVNLKIAGKMLTKLGVDVDKATNGLLAVEACVRQSYDLVFMDVSMPVMDGPEAVAKIREAESHGTGARIPIVALTAHAIAGAKDRFLEQGYDDYLAKPIDQSALKATMTLWTAPQDDQAQVSNQPQALTVDL